MPTKKEKLQHLFYRKSQTSNKKNCKFGCAKTCNNRTDKQQGRLAETWYFFDTAIF